MDFDGTISTEVALINDKLATRDDMVTRGTGPTNGNSGKPMSAQLGVGGGFIPKERQKNIDVAKVYFMKYLIQPQNVVNNYFEGQPAGRWLPAQPSLVKSDPFLARPERSAHRKAYVRRGRVGRNGRQCYPVLNPGWAEVHAQQVWGAAAGRLIIRNGMPRRRRRRTRHLKKIESDPRANIRSSEVNNIDRQARGARLASASVTVDASRP